MVNRIEHFVNIGPGDIIKDELETLDLSVEDLTSISGLPEHIIKGVISNDKPISPNIAESLNKAI